MAQTAVYFTFILSILYNVCALNLPGPLVYVVTPSPRTPAALSIDEGRSAPFYYRNWMRRMDSPQNVSSTTTTTTPKVETPDLIFADFESHNGDNYRKSLRNLLEKEKIEPKTSTSAKPIYVPDDIPEKTPQINYEVPDSDKGEDEKYKATTPDRTDYFALYNNLYGNNDVAPVFIPTSTRPAIVSTTTTTTTADQTLNNVADIWHVIDSEKQNQFTGKWEEVPVDAESDKTNSPKMKPDEETQKEDKVENVDIIDDNFSLPGFGTNPGNGAENESRAIRTEPNIRFPYINLKPFQVKNSLANTKKNNNAMFNLDSLHEITKPVRGEVQDGLPFRQAIDRYNPAQPYLPPSKYGNINIKQDSSQDSPPVKSVASLVPPPPPPPPSAGDNFPVPDSYESFPPFASIDTNPAPAPAAVPASRPRPAALAPPAPKYRPPVDTPNYDSPTDDGDSDGPPTMDLGYRYKPPSPPAKPFLPTLPPLSKPFKGYSYDKPMVPMDDPPVMDKPHFPGYHYKKPEPDAPGSSDDHPPSPNYEHPPSPAYGHHGPPSYEPDYPELIYNKHHGDDSKGGDDMKAGDDMKGNDMGMMPPPPDVKPDMGNAGPPSDDQGFPHDFPGDFKYHHDFDDLDFYHHHHHHPTTTTTTTEMPRVNRYSYYYLGKKLYYLPLYFSVYFICYVAALIIKAVLRHKIVYPNSFRPNDQTSSFFSKRSVDSWDLSNENLHEITGKVTAAIGKAAEKYMNKETKQE